MHMQCNIAPLHAQHQFLFLSNIEKIFQKVIYSRITNILECQNPIYSRHFGFRKSHSSLHTLTVKHIRKNLDNDELVCGIFFVPQKVFDTVHHHKL